MKISPFKSSRFTSKWYISLVDTFLLAIVYYLVIFLRFDFNIQKFTEYVSIWHLFTLVFISVLTSFMLGTNRSSIRYTSISDVISLVKANISALLITTALMLFTKSVDILSFLSIPTSIIFLFYVVGTFIQILARLSYRAIFDLKQNKVLSKKNILIYGAGSAGIVTKDVLLPLYFKMHLV